MADARGSWLSGPPSNLPEDAYAGQRLGLPESGPGSTATSGRKALGFLADLVAAYLIGSVARLLHRGISGGDLNIVQTVSFLVEVLLLQSLSGQSIGQRLTGTRLVSIGTGRTPLPGSVALRLLLTCLPVPGLGGVLPDRDRRGYQDKFSGTAVVLV